MRAGPIVKSLKDIMLIQQFIQRGARVPMLRAQFPNIPEAPIREMYYNEHGDTSKRGLTPDSTLSIVKNLNTILHANMFYNIYRAQGGDSIFTTLDASTMLLAYDQYKALDNNSKYHLDFITAWYIARDLRSRILYVRMCKKCGLERLYALHDKWIVCPFCKSVSRGKNRAKRAALKINRDKLIEIK